VSPTKTAFDRSRITHHASRRPHFFLDLPRSLASTLSFPFPFAENQTVTAAYL
jgi:hypothetical protein